MVGETLSLLKLRCNSWTFRLAPFSRLTSEYLALPTSFEKTFCPADKASQARVGPYTPLKARDYFVVNFEFERTFSL
jgi:hypothetical protein